MSGTITAALIRTIQTSDTGAKPAAALGARVLPAGVALPLTATVVASGSDGLVLRHGTETLTVKPSADLPLGQRVRLQAGTGASAGRAVLVPLAGTTERAGPSSSFEPARPTALPAASGGWTPSAIPSAIPSAASPPVALLGALAALRAQDPPRSREPRVPSAVPSGRSADAADAIPVARPARTFAWPQSLEASGTPAKALLAAATNGGASSMGPTVPVVGPAFGSDLLRMFVVSDPSTLLGGAFAVAAEDRMASARYETSSGSNGQEGTTFRFEIELEGFGATAVYGHLNDGVLEATLRVDTALRSVERDRLSEAWRAVLIEFGLVGALRFDAPERFDDAD